MKNNSGHIEEHILLNYIKRESSQKDVDLVEKWLNESPENFKILDAFKKVWYHSSALSDFQNIDTEEDWEAVKSRINLKSSSKIRKLQISNSIFPFIFRVAASIAIIFGIVYLSIQYLNQSPQTITLSTNDFQKSVLLADGSLVHLNENSELSYPEKFIEDYREVHLRGEAFFEVSKNIDKSFIIKTDNNAEIKVLGTKFNVEIRDKSSEVTVQVVEGKVALYDSNHEDNSIELEKNEMGVMKNNNISKSNHLQRNFLSWKTGTLIFENTLLRDVVTDLMNYYKKPIRLDNIELEEYKITTTIDNQPLGEVLEEIKLILNLDYLTKNDTIEFYEHSN